MYLDLKPYVFRLRVVTFRFPRGDVSDERSKSLSSSSSSLTCPPPRRRRDIFISCVYAPPALAFEISIRALLARAHMYRTFSEWPCLASNKILREHLGHIVLANGSSPELPCSVRKRSFLENIRDKLGDLRFQAFGARRLFALTRARAVSPLRPRREHVFIDVSVDLFPREQAALERIIPPVITCPTFPIGDGFELLVGR